MAEKQKKQWLKITRDENGKHRWDKLVSYWSCVILSIAFIKEAGTNTLEWLDYIGYACGMAISFSPYLGVKFIQAWRGQGEPPEAPAPDDVPVADVPAQKGVD